jgi:DNA helicase-2/ATP-dependent DNA helicase PcrA
MVRDPQGFARDLRRPLPRRPARSSRTGTLFHQWIEGFFDAPAALGDEDEFVDTEDAYVLQSIAELRAAFERSWWARQDNGLTLYRAELDVATPLEGGISPGRIDAVFKDPDGGYVIVDWKTGRRPSTPEDKWAAQLQLRIYRRALSRLLGVDPERIRAAFHDVAHTKGDTPDDPSIRWLDIAPTPDELHELEHLVGQRFPTL